MRSSGSSPENASASSPLHVDCYRSWSALTGMRAKWDSFVESVGGDLFSSFDWCEIWWRHFGFGRRLEIYVVRSGDEWVAIFPLFRETISWGPMALRVIRLVGCDHCVTTCGLPIKSGLEAEAIRQLLEQLRKGEPWDVLQFGELAGYADSTSELATSVRAQLTGGKTAYQSDCYPHMIFDVPHNLEAFLSGLSVKERRNVRKDQRELEAVGATFCEPKSPEQLHAAFDRLVAMHESQWRIRGRGGHFEDWPGAESFHREFASRALISGRLALIEVRTSKQVLACEYAIRFGSRLHWIIGARANGVSSRIGYLGLLDRAWKDGLKLIDGLPGYYDYKRRLGAQVVGVKDILAVNNRGASRRRFALHRAAAEAISFAYGRVWWWHVAPWLSRRMPHLFARKVHDPMWISYIRSRFLATRERPDESTSQDTQSPANQQPDGVKLLEGDRE